ncbi:MAG TPA: CoA pyrophosphatase [Gemmatimonadaceae bacterium]|nr:CoA pyrophosphatase [Gemmatimonadaceae bacterium]HJU67815.1 CoA pyrophosphatase [Gemmatimonadaceae bacterium]
MQHHTEEGTNTELDRLAQHPAIAPLVRAMAGRAPALVDLDDASRRAAVALLVRLDESREQPTPQLLMIKRATFEGDPWSGHVALPGGRREPADPTLERTVIRETWEETAIDLERDGRLLGCLDELAPRTPVLPPIIITPFVGLVRFDVDIVASPEVAEWFWVDVAALRDPDVSREVVLELATGPRAVMSFQHGAHTIWGLTERILRQFLSLAP